jgi:hypothetical protein
MINNKLDRAAKIFVTEIFLQKEFLLYYRGINGRKNTQQYVRYDIVVSA